KLRVWTLFGVSVFCWSIFFFFFSSRRRHTRFSRDWSSDVCSSDLFVGLAISMAYTGILQSRLGGGRTPGKRMLGLRVVRLDGARSEERRVGKEWRSRGWRKQ